MMKIPVSKMFLLLAAFVCLTSCDTNKIDNTKIRIEEKVEKIDFIAGIRIETIPNEPSDGLIIIFQIKNSSGKPISNWEDFAIKHNFMVVAKDKNSSVISEKYYRPRPIVERGEYYVYGGDLKEGTLNPDESVGCIAPISLSKTTDEEINLIGGGSYQISCEIVGMPEIKFNPVVIKVRASDERFVPSIVVQ